MTGLKMTAPTAALIAALSGGSVAAEGWWDGIYLRAQGGGSFLRDADAQPPGGAPSGVSFDGGFVVAGAVGYEITDNILIEAEYAYRSADVDRFDAPGFGSGGDFASVILTANALYRLDGWETPIGQRLRPYAGFGVGFTQEIDLDIGSGASAGEYEDSGGFVWQVRGGLDWKLSDAVALNAELRYVDAGEPTFSGPGGARLDVGYAAVEGLVGLSYRF